MRCQSLDADGLDAELAAERRPVVIDLRSPAAFEAGHVPGARNIPGHELGRRLSELPKSKVARILLIGEPGRRSEAGATFLALMGYVDVALVAGGMAAYRGAPETGPAKSRPPQGPELRIIP